MNLLNNAIKALWHQFYDSFWGNISSDGRIRIGLTLVIGALIVFVFSAKGSAKKGAFIQNGFLFWISVIMAIMGILYLTRSV